MLALFWLPSARHRQDMREAVLHLLQNRYSELSAEGRVVGESWRLRQTAQAFMKAFAVFHLVGFFCFVVCGWFLQDKTFFTGVFKLSPQFYEHHSWALQQLQGLYSLHRREACAHETVRSELEAEGLWQTSWSFSNCKFLKWQRFIAKGGRVQLCTWFS